MKFRSDRRGQIRVIEAFFASMLILSTLTMIPAFQPRSPAAPSNVLSSQALNALTILDGDGHLSALVDEGNWTALRLCVAALVSPAVWFNVSVFTQNMVPLNNVTISNGAPASDCIASAEYLCVSTSEAFVGYVVRLQLAAVD